ncbi:protein NONRESPONDING TO OXYLIPINS 2, mitochondrial-like isoform X2 [Silene latifolia]|uniref:protein NONRESPONDING TO OXYLIPINS 2, mitochondrial-like isoform X2 n=1 Tax=Silene latifolia TaxID=37657 RepID=UPI003D7899A0
MASRYRSISRPTINLFKSSFASKPTSNSIPTPHFSPSSSSFPRSFPQMVALQSLLPLHSAVSSARLTSCLGIDSCSSRSLSQGMLSANPGV